jgi:hypothetical protein
MEIHFYPGQHLLIVRNKRAIIGRFEAWGGPSSIVLHPGAMQEEPTWPGRYVIERAEAYRTPSWERAKIKWGTRLKDTKTDVMYQLPSGAWGSLSKDFNISRAQVQEWNFDLYGLKVIPATWLFNDFGPIAIRWFKDANGNKILDGKERLSGQMFHTTPYDEMRHAQKKPVHLVASHGCIHLKPAERDRLFAIGAFKPKTDFIIHRYNEKIVF